MAKIFDLHNPERTRQFVLQGFWLQCTQRPSAETAAAALRAALELANTDEVIPPTGLIADLSQIVIAAQFDHYSSRSDSELAGLSREWLYRVGDHVLGKVLSDRNFDRAAEALRRYQGRDRDRALAYLSRSIQASAGRVGAVVNSAVLRSVLNEPIEAILAEGWESCTAKGFMQELLDCYEAMIAGYRRAGELVSSPLVFDLESGTALSATSQRLAQNHVLSAVQLLSESIPQRRPNPQFGPQQAPSRLLTEDAYPVGGFASLSNKGSIESLLFSQLAYMEKAGRPDLFDVKFLRDELLYYSRDENLSYRRRRTYVIALFDDLAHARCKDPGLDHQRVIMVLAVLKVVIDKLTHWLSDESLRFNIVFAGSADALEWERELLEKLFRESIENGSVAIADAADTHQLADMCAVWARSSQCQCLLVANQDHRFAPDDVAVCRLQTGLSIPALKYGGGEEWLTGTANPIEAWTACVERLLENWI